MLQGILRRILPFVLLTAHIVFLGDSDLAHANDLLETDWNRYSLEEQRKLNTFFDEIQAAIPPKLLSSIQHPIYVEFISFNTGNIFGRLRQSLFSSKIQLARTLLPNIMDGTSGSRRLASHHHDYYTFSKAIVIHELSHAYDAGTWLATLNYLTGRLGRISGDRQFLNLLSWENSYLSTTKTQTNTLVSRSPDPYEYKDPSESFAVNMEFFLLDPFFGCKKPAVYKYLKRHFDFIPFTKLNCNTNDWVPALGNSLSETPVSMQRIDLSRLYEIHYLQATGGNNFLSRWGHSMIRLVMCSSHRAEKGPKCLTEDVQDHLVLSYRANLGDLGDLGDLLSQNWKLLKQVPPSELFVLRMPDLITTYTRDDLRDLISIPLSLTEDQQKMMVYRALEQIWTYRGRYTFVTRNCATEAETLLSCCLESGNSYFLDSKTPLGLFHQLLKNNLTQESKYWDKQGSIIDEAQAERAGYFFKSKRAQLEENYEALPELKEYFGNQSMENYLNYSSADKRLAAYQEMISFSGADSQGKINISARFFVLEAQLLRMRKTTFLNKVTDEFFGNSQKRSESIAEYRKWLQLTQPRNLIQSGYGIPSEEQMNQAFESRIVPKALDLSLLRKQVMEEAKIFFPNESNELTLTRENLDIFITGI